MPPDRQIPLKKLSLYALIGSVSVSALLGIATILMGDFGRFEIRVLLTSLTITAASLCGLSCGATLEANRARRLPVCGIALAGLAALLIIVGIWADPHSDVYWKTTATIGIFAVACSQMALLLLARLAPRFRWTTPVSYASVFGVGAIVTVMLWGEIDAEPMYRLLGVRADVHWELPRDL